MKNGLRIIDSDLHVIEPGNLWQAYLDPKFRHRVTKHTDALGHVRPHVDGKVMPPYADRPRRHFTYVRQRSDQLQSRLKQAMRMTRWRRPRPPPSPWR